MPLIFADISAMTSATTGSAITFKSYVMPAGQLSTNSQGLLITSWGTSREDNASARTVKLVFGGTTLASIFTAGQTLGSWQAQAVVFRTGASAEQANTSFIATLDGGSTPKSIGIAGLGLAAPTASTITIETTISQESTTAITQNGMIVQTLVF